ncbi:calpain small subunit 1-like isoform X1 [Hypomesus transpacificus]|uniref:calpain small subunit 1-like isoform X1 n=1 Tax=Hypomesus transpacificus TaxID=137520 RepID=UPI001F0745B5|nr:calpain small subunit 1-like isoform X1 [Hypomesus transpacificus]
MFLAKRLIGGILDVVSNIDPGQFVPSDPPPPRRPLAYGEQNESEEVKRFRKVFHQLAGDDMEVSPKELMDILNRILGKHGDIKTDGFSIESCRSMVAVMDSDSTGKLGFHEFKFLWDNIKRWQVSPVCPQPCLCYVNKCAYADIGISLKGYTHQNTQQCVARRRCQLRSSLLLLQGIYKTHDEDRSGIISATELPRAFEAAGFPLNDQLFQLIIRRYSDEHGNMDFDNYIGCLVRLDAMCRAFKTLDKDNNGTIKVNVQEWLQLTMYS